jgi:hypothetical protein
MLAWVVIYRRHLQHSTPIPSSLRTLRLCVQLSRPDPARVTAHYCFKSFRRNTYGSPASVANKRLTARLSPLDATLTKNGGHVLQTKYFFSVLAPFACPCLPSSVRSSKFRIPQPLCLPLLRKLPGVYQQFPFWNSTCVLANPFPTPLSSFNSPPGGILWVAL